MSLALNNRAQAFLYILPTLSKRSHLKDKFTPIGEQIFFLSVASKRVTSIEISGKHILFLLELLPFVKGGKLLSV